MKYKRKIARILTIVIILSMLVNPVNNGTVAWAAEADFVSGKAKDAVGNAETEQSENIDTAGESSTETDASNQGIGEDVKPEENEAEPPAEPSNEIKEAEKPTEEIKKAGDTVVPSEAAVESSDQMSINNADEALVVGRRASYEAESTLSENGLILQWQVCEDGENWVDLDGETNWWYEFTVTEDMFSKWYRIVGTSADEKTGEQKVYTSAAVQPVKAVCYVEGHTDLRETGTVQGYNSLQAAFDQSTDLEPRTITITSDITIDAPIKVKSGKKNIFKEETNTYYLKSEDNAKFCVTSSVLFTGEAFFLQDRTSSNTGNMELVFQNIIIDGGGTVENLVKMVDDKGWLYVQGDTELLNPQKNIVDYSAGAAVDALKINSGQEGAAAGSIKMDGKVVFPDVGKHIKVFGATANFTPDTDIAIAVSTANAWSDNVTLVEYTQAADPYELAYFRLQNPGDYWIGFAERKSVNAKDLPAEKYEEQLAVLDGRPDRIFVKEHAEDQLAPSSETEWTYVSDEYSDGANPYPIYRSSNWYRLPGPVPTLSAGYARIKQLNNDDSETPRTAVLVICETQQLRGTFTIGGTSYQQTGSTTLEETAEKSVNFSWKNPAELQRFIARDSDIDINPVQLNQMIPTLIDVQENGQLTLDNITVNGRPETVYKDFETYKSINSPLITSHGNNVILNGAKIINNENSRIATVNILVTNGFTLTYHVDNGYGGGIAIYSGDLTLENNSSISNCCVYRGGKSAGEGQEETPEAYGGGIFFTGNGSLTISDSVVENNKLSSSYCAYGGGIYITGLDPQEQNPVQTSPKLVLKNGAKIQNNQGITSVTLPNTGESQTNKGYYYGVGIAAVDGTVCTMENGSEVCQNIVQNGKELYSGNFGGGIFGLNSTLNLNGGIVSGNQTMYSSKTNQAYGGGVCSTGSSSLTIANTAIENNTGTNGGGIYIGPISAGVGAYGEKTEKGGTASISAGTIKGNQAAVGGGICVKKGSNLEITNNAVIEANIASSNGGGVALNDGAVLTMNTGTIKGNQAQGGKGGGIWNESSPITLTGVQIGKESIAGSKEEATAAGGNVSAGNGGGIALTGTAAQSVVFKNLSLLGNWSDAAGGGISVESQIKEDTGQVLTFTGTTVIKGNQANNGGGISSSEAGWFHENNNGKDEVDGIFTMQIPTLPIVFENGAVLENNKAVENGGGIYASNNIKITGETAAIIGNSAGQNGGGIYLHASDPSSQVNEDWQFSIENGTESSYHIRYDVPKMVLNESSFENNTAGNYGGAIYTGDFLRNVAAWDNNANFKKLYRQIFAEAASPFTGGFLTLRLNGGTFAGNAAAADSVSSSAIYQSDATRIELAGSLNIAEDQKIWLSKSDIEWMEPYTSDNGYAQDGSDGVVPYTGAFLSVIGELTVNGTSADDALKTMHVDFPNYIYKRVIAKYENGLSNPNVDEVPKYTAVKEKLDEQGLQVDNEAANILLLRDSRYTGFTFKKYGQADAESTDKIPLAGITFALYATTADTPGDYVGAANDNGSWIQKRTAISAIDGTVDFGLLLPGTYMLVETNTSINYIKPIGQWKIVINKDKTITISGVPISGVMPPEFTETAADGNIVYQVSNYEQDASKFQFTKIDSLSKKAIKGVQFKLDYLICDNTEESHTHTEVCWEKLPNTVDGTYIFSSSNEGIVDFGKLASKTYRMTEIQTNTGYILPTSALIFTFDAEKGKVTKQSSDDSSYKLSEKKVNDVITYSLENVKSTTGRDFSFIKTDEVGNPLSGAAFILLKHDENDTESLYHDETDWYDRFDSSTNVILWNPVTQIVDGLLQEEFVSGREGRVNLGFLEDGEYLLIETSAPLGYNTPEGQWEILVGSAYTDGTVYEGKDFGIIGIGNYFADPCVPPPEMTVKEGTDEYTVANEPAADTVPFSFIKVTAENTDNPMQGVAFELYQCTDPKHNHAADDTTLVSPDDTTDCWEKVRSVISDADGLVNFGNLPYNSYMLVETKTNAGYQLPTGQWLIEIDDMASDLITITGKGERLPPAFMLEINLDGGSSGTIGMTYKLPNMKEVVLPFTGLDGILRYLLTGAVFIALAGVLFFLFKKKRIIIEEQNHSERSDDF